jgi:hypothetical protein
MRGTHLLEFPAFESNMALPKPPQKRAVSMLEIAELTAIFQSKQWSNESIHRMYQEKFDKIVELLPYFDVDESKLILELVKNFLYCNFTTEFAYRLQLEEKLIEVLKNKNHILVVPLKELDSVEVKSSLKVLYDFKDFFNSRFPGKTITQKSEVDIADINNSSFHTLVFLDDFVGSGSTFIDIRNDISSKGGRIITDTFLFCYIAQEEGANRISTTVSPNCLHYAELRKKGITDYFQGEGQAKAISLMCSIEKKLRISPRFRFGYMASEALVSLTRTPNNTFPLFWYSDLDWFAPPFPRPTKKRVNDAR